MEKITAKTVRRLLPPRRADGHKGDFGRVYVYGGCAGYTGAPVYAGEAAVRTGSGLVFVAGPHRGGPVRLRHGASSPGAVRGSSGSGPGL